MKKVLVTGATGFIGKHLIHLLIQKKIAVCALIRNLKKVTMLPDEVEIIEGDLTNPKSLIDACISIDTIFHLGGFAHAWEEENSSFAEQHNNINFHGTKNLLEEAIRSDVKSFIFFSSVKAVADSEVCVDEKWNDAPNSPYGKAKRDAEHLVLAAKKNGMHVCVLRPALVYGPNWKGNLASMLHAVDRGIFPPIPETHNCRSLVSIDDICSAAILAAEQPEANGQIYFVTDGKGYSSRELYTLMRQALQKRLPKWHIPLAIFKLLAIIGDSGKKLLGRRLPFCSETMKKLFGSAHYNSEKIQRELGFYPKYDLKKMLPSIIEAYQAQKGK